VRSEQEYFDEIQDVKVTKDMLDLARHIVNQRAGRFDPEKFEDHYETALIDLINQKRAGKPITPKGKNVVDLMEALRRSVGKECPGGQACKKRADGRGRPKGDADADFRDEAGERGSRQEARGRNAPEVGVKHPVNRCGR